MTVDNDRFKFSLYKQYILIVVKILQITFSISTDIELFRDYNFFKFL